MRLMFAAAIAIFLLIYYLSRGKKGVGEFREIITNFLGNSVGKYVLITGVTSAILLILMLVTGLITFQEILEMERLEFEICPYCL